MTQPDALAPLVFDPSGGALGLTLPPGRVHYDTEDGAGDRALYWLSEEAPSPGAWATLRAAHARTGLWPLLLGGLSDRDPDRPWISGELYPTLVTSDPGSHDAATVLAQWWTNYGAADNTGWPGLAPPGAGQRDPDDAAAEAALLLTDSGGLIAPRLGLVPARRGADALADVGWSGPVNYENDTALFSAVLRSWEDRFGARVVSLGFDTLFLSVAAPPADEDQARRVAAEHFAFCPDNVWQGSGSLQEYATELVGAFTWGFWWD